MFNSAQQPNLTGYLFTDYLVLFLKVFVSFISWILGLRECQSQIVGGQKLFVCIIVGV